MRRFQFVGTGDTNHNVKNARGQIVGVGSASSIGNHCIDPWLFKMGKVAKEIPVVSDFASDALVLATASVKVTRAIIELKCDDAGNALVSFSATVLRMFPFPLPLTKSFLLLS